MTEGKKTIMIGGITLAVYGIFRYLLPYVIPFLSAYILVHLMNPLVEKIQRKLPWKKEAILSVLLIVILGSCFALFYYGYCLLTEQLRRIAENFDLYYSRCCTAVDTCCRMAEEKFGVQTNEMRNFVYASLNEATGQIQADIVPKLLNHSVRYLKKVLQAWVFLLILFIAVILLMKDYDEMKEKLQQYSWYGRCHNVVRRMWFQGGRYMKAQAAITGIVMLLCILGLWALGNPYFMVLGIVTGLLDVLPFIGTGTVFFPVAVVLFFQKRFHLGLGYAGLFLLTYLVREFMEPRMIGAKLGIYPFVMAAVVYAGLYLYGSSGVLLGPVTLLTVREIWRELAETYDKKIDLSRKM